MSWYHQILSLLFMMIYSKLLYIFMFTFLYYKFQGMFFHLCFLCGNSRFCYCLPNSIHGCHISFYYIFMYCYYLPGSIPCKPRPFFYVFKNCYCLLNNVYWKPHLFYRYCCLLNDVNNLCGKDLYLCKGPRARVTSYPIAKEPRPIPAR